MDLILKGQRLLQAKGVEAARLESELLLSHILSCDRHQLYSSPQKKLDSSIVDKFMALLKRRLAGEPIQYILAYREFMGLRFDLDKSVLIPRWETEILVKHIIDQAQGRPVKLLDIGTGSGAIAVSLAYYLPQSRLVAIDISQEALDRAEKNAIKHGVSHRIDFKRSDMFAALEADSYQDYFDIIVSNPPYIKSQDIEGLMPEVRDFEPRTALDGGADGLKFYRQIAENASIYLKVGGLVAMEMGHDQASDIKDIFKRTGNYSSGQILKDLAGIDRIALFHKVNKG